MSEREQADEIRRLLDCQTRKASPVVILQLDLETCTVSDVNRHFRRIALLLHPDKCKLPHTAIAFHIAEKAHKMLSQEAILLHLKHAYQKRKEKENAEESIKAEHHLSNASCAGANVRAAGAASPTYGHLSHLAQSGLSNESQKSAEIARLTHAKPTDYFIILDLDPVTCEVADVDKRYRKMAQALHPDKCQLPDVTVAFTVLERAHKELSDEKKLVRYKVAFQQRQKTEATLQGELQRRRNTHNEALGESGMSTEERLQHRKRQALREQQLEAARLAEETARKRQRVEKEQREKAELSAELERQRQEWRDMQML